MMFCPKCGSILTLKPNKKIGCNNCSYTTKQKKLILKEKTDKAKKIEIIDKGIDVLPQTDIKCPKCGNDKAFYWLVQTRASDEGETQFFRCTKCNHIWRSYGWRN